MKKSVLILLTRILLGTLILGSAISIIGWLLGWDTPAKFGNGLFIAGIILVVLGILSVSGGYSMRSDFKVIYSQSAGDMNGSERTKRWIADMIQGYAAFLYLLPIGGLLIGLAILVGNFF